jgi:hypothetical protein
MYVRDNDGIWPMVENPIKNIYAVRNHSVVPRKRGNRGNVSFSGPCETTSPSLCSSVRNGPSDSEE